MAGVCSLSFPHTSVPSRWVRIWPGGFAHLAEQHSLPATNDSSCALNESQPDISMQMSQPESVSVLHSLQPSNLTPKLKKHPWLCFSSSAYLLTFPNERMKKVTLSVCWGHYYSKSYYLDLEIYFYFKYILFLWPLPYCFPDKIKKPLNWFYLISL